MKVEEIPGDDWWRTLVGHLLNRCTAEPSCGYGGEGDQLVRLEDVRDDAHTRVSLSKSAGCLPVWCRIIRVRQGNLVIGLVIRCSSPNC